MRYLQSNEGINHYLFIYSCIIPFYSTERDLKTNYV